MSESIVKDEVKQNVFLPGDLLWTKLPQYPFWPSMVTYAPDSGVYIRAKGKRQWSYHVQYFGEDTKRGWTPNATLSCLPFEGEKKYFETIEKLKSQKKPVKKYKIQELHKNNWQISVTEAEEALLLTNRRARFENYVFRFEKTQTPTGTGSVIDFNEKADPLKPRPSKKIQLSKNSDAVCDACQENNVEVLCSGQCGRSFHLGCYGLQNMPKHLKCIDCLSSELVEKEVQDACQDEVKAPSEIKKQNNSTMTISDLSLDFENPDSKSYCSNYKKFAALKKRQLKIIIKDCQYSQNLESKNTVQETASNSINSENKAGSAVDKKKYSVESSKTPTKKRDVSRINLTKTKSVDGINVNKPSFKKRKILKTDSEKNLVLAIKSDKNANIDVPNFTKENFYKKSSDSEPKQKEADSSCKKKKHSTSLNNIGLSSESKKLPVISGIKRKKKVSFSDDLDLDKPAISEKKQDLIDCKISPQKSISPIVYPTAKSQKKKVARRKRFRLVVNEDEPPLFSQPDDMIKVKSDNVLKKDEKKNYNLPDLHMKNQLCSSLIEESNSIDKPSESNSKDKQTNDASVPQKDVSLKDPIIERGFEKQDVPTEITEVIEKLVESENKRKDTTHFHRSHLFDLNCKICTGKIVPPPVAKSISKKHVAHSISFDNNSSTDSVEKSVSRIVEGKSLVSSTGEDSVDQVTTSTVSIRYRKIIIQPSSNCLSKSTSAVWKGCIVGQEKFFILTSAFQVSGKRNQLHSELPNTIKIDGRIAPKLVWDYLGKIKQSGKKELIVIRFSPANAEEAVAYHSFYSHLSRWKEYGVVTSHSKKIKNFYIFPLAAASPVPTVLIPFDGPGLPSPKPHLLLGVIVRHKSTLPKQKPVPKVEVVKTSRSRTPPPEPRSYTPPLPNSESPDESSKADLEILYSR